MVIKHSTSAEEVTETRTLQEMHWQEVQKHYDEKNFDFNVLLGIKNRDGLDWKLSPQRGDTHSRDLVKQRLFAKVSEIGHASMPLLCKNQLCAECCF